MNSQKPVLITGDIRENQEVARDQFLLSCKLPATFPPPVPGQFIMVKTHENNLPFLRRPFSIYDFIQKEDFSILKIIYRVVGQGTRLLASLAAGAPLSIVGPLGQGFDIVQKRKNIIMIAGGIGIAPLSFLASWYDALMKQQNGSSRTEPNRRIICYAGSCSSDHLIGLEKMENLSEEIKISTDDGSCGYHGNVIELFRRDRAFYNPDDAAIYACGPTSMLRSLRDALGNEALFCQVSTEERMACGLGACLGCAITCKTHDEGPVFYKRVCKDGPVFNLQDLDLG